MMEQEQNHRKISHFKNSGLKFRVSPTADEGAGNPVELVEQGDEKGVPMEIHVLGDNKNRLSEIKSEQANKALGINNDCAIFVVQANRLAGSVCQNLKSLQFFDAMKTLYCIHKKYSFRMWENIELFSL